MAVTQDVRNKVVVRKLPPGISQEEVRAAIDDVCPGKYDWFVFVSGKIRYHANLTPDTFTSRKYVKLCLIVLLVQLPLALQFEAHKAF